VTNLRAMGAKAAIYAWQAPSQAFNVLATTLSYRHGYLLPPMDSLVAAEPAARSFGDFPEKTQ
jgi:hypothetical protein